MSDTAKCETKAKGGNEISSPWSSVSLAGLLSALLVGSLYALTADIDLDRLDEGFLWYGGIQTAAGEIPIRDFQAYEPGRYYRCAAWSALFGTGILSLRLSTAIFLGLGRLVAE